MAPLSERDRRALLLLGAAVAAFLILQFGAFPGRDAVRPSTASLDLLEKRLARLQGVSRERPRAAAAAESAAQELAQAERGLLKGATPAQASAEMQQLLRDLLGAQGIGMRSSEFGPVRKAGDDYAQVPLTVNFTCGIEQWINLMAALRNAPQILSTVDVRLRQGDQKNKTVEARMVVAGYIPASLADAHPQPGGKR